MNNININTQRIALIAQRHHLQLVALYGSYAKGTERRESDIDIAALGLAPLSFETLLLLHNEFSDAFPGKEVDIQSLHRAAPFFQYQVMKDGVILFGDRHLFTRLKVYAIRMHQKNFKLRHLRDVLLAKRQKHLESLFIHA